MEFLSHPSEAFIKLAKALTGDLKATSVTLHMSVAEPVRIVIEHIVEKEQGDKIIEEIEKIKEEYILVKREIPKDAEDV